MALPTFLSPSELIALQERAVKARDEINAMVAQLEAAGELTVMVEFRKASGSMYKAIRTVHNHAQTRLRVAKRRADYVAECVREGSVVPGSKLLEPEGIPADPRLVKAIFGENSPEFKGLKGGN